ncbi:MAG: alpha/beta fold hydrolase, partial [Betaproteobacteria bacterium]
MKSAAQNFRFGRFEMRCAQRSLLVDGKAAIVGARAFDLLVALIEQRDRVVTANELFSLVWPGVVVEENNLRQQIAALRKTLGSEAVITIPGRGYRFALALDSDIVDARNHGTATSAESPTIANNAARVSELDALKLQQEIRFCTAPDGVQLAYSTIGRGPTIVKTGNWMTHLEYDLQSPIWRHLYCELTRDHTLARYDARGNGLSDRDVDEISFDAFVSDLETVVDALGIKRFALFGLSQGCATSVAYAVRHPERVSHLILYGGFAQGARKATSNPVLHAAVSTLLDQMRLGWETPNPAFRQVWTSLFMPDASKEQADWFNELERISVNGDMAARIEGTAQEIDVTALLPRVTVPTLVMHARDDAAIPFKAGRRLAAGIPGARFVPLDGRNHLFLESEPA